MAGELLPHHVEKATTPAQREACMAIRHTVFIEEQGCPPEMEIDDPEDPLSTHFLLLVRGKAAGTVRVNDPRGKLGRLAILPEFRGARYGASLVSALHAHVGSMGGDRVWAEVEADDSPGKVNATGFYRRVGYKPFGPTYYKVGILHQNMEYRMS